VGDDGLRAVERAEIPRHALLGLDVEVSHGLVEEHDGGPVDVGFGERVEPQALLEQ
jgi:hypothetical protein